MKAYSEYKDSGLQWIGKVPKHWVVSRLKYFCEPLKSGGTPKSDDSRFYAAEGIPWVAIADMSSTPLVIDTAKHLTEEGIADKNLNIFPSGTILYSIYATLGKVSELAVPACINQAILAINPDKRYCKTYFKYCLTAQEQYVYSLSNGNTQNNLNAEKVANFFMVLPTLPEQQAIASFLDAKTKPIDNIIAKREKQIELLEEIKSAIISRAVTKGLNPDAKMKDSGIEWIKTEPQSWETRRIKNVITLLTDYDANGSFADIAKNVKVNVGEPYAWMVRATDLANKRYGIVDDNNYCNKETFDFLSKSSLEAGDILIAKRGDIGKSYEVPKCDCPMTLAPNTYLLKTNKQVINNRFFHYFFMSDYGKKQLSINNKSTTIGAIYKEDVKNLKILLPPMDEQQAIASYLDSETSKIDSRIAKRRKQIELLQEYKQALITAAVTGKIDVRE